MKYDFTTIMQRAGEDAIAIDGLGKGGMAPEHPRRASMPSPCG